MDIAILLFTAVIHVPGEPAEPTEAEAVRVADRAKTNMVRVASPLGMSVASDAVMVERTSSYEDAQVVAELKGGNDAGEYVPFAGVGWRWNEVWNASYPATDDGLDTWTEMKTDGLGTIWAIYTGTTTSYTMDTIFVFCSTDNGSTWLYRVAIYTTTANYDPWVARLSVDRINNWVYISNVLAAQAGGGNYYPGTMWVTRFQHTGGGAISSLGTYLCDPAGFGETYSKGAVACDGSGSSYVYLGAIDWVSGYMDYYRSADRGATWSYITSWDLGNQWTDAISATPRYGSSGAIIGWIDWDDVNGDYDYCWAEVTSSTQNGYYFGTGGTGFRALYSMAAYGTRWVAPLEEEASGTNFDAYFYYYDGSGYSLYTWDATATDVRSPAMDMIAQSNAVLMSTYRQTSGLNGRPYFCWATVADMSTWYLYTPCEYDVFNSDAITVAASQHWKFVDVAATPNAFGTYNWTPHIMWRRTSGATGGGDPWHSWPDPSVGAEEAAGGKGLFAAFVGKGIAYSVPGSTSAKLSVYDATGRMVCGTENTLSGKGVLELPDLNQGVYFFTFTTEGFGSTRGSFALK